MITCKLCCPRHTFRWKALSNVILRNYTRDNHSFANALVIVEIVVRISCDGSFSRQIIQYALYEAKKIFSGEDLGNTLCKLILCD